MTAIRQLIDSAHTRISNLNKPWRIIIASVAFIVGTIGLLWVCDKILIFFLARTYVDELTELFDLNKHLATAISWIVFATAVIFLRYAFSFSKSRRQLGVLGILVLIVGHSVLLWRGSA